MNYEIGISIFLLNMNKLGKNNLWYTKLHSLDYEIKLLK